MEIALAGGVLVDLATRDDIEGFHRKLAEKLVPPHAKYFPVSGSGATAAGFSGSGPIAVAFNPQSPPPGRLWSVQWVAVWVGTTPAAGAVANLFAAVCVGNSQVGAGGPPRALTANISDVVIPGQAVPSGINVPDKTIVKPDTQLYVLFGGAGLAASTVYNCTAGVLDMPATDEATLW
jgi:hypothetical protein